MPGNALKLFHSLYCAQDICTSAWHSCRISRGQRKTPTEDATDETAIDWTAATTAAPMTSMAELAQRMQAMEAQMASERAQMLSAVRERDNLTNALPTQMMHVQPAQVPAQLQHVLNTRKTSPESFGGSLQGVPLQDLMSLAGQAFRPQPTPFPSGQPHFPWPADHRVEGDPGLGRRRRRPGPVSWALSLFVAGVVAPLRLKGGGFQSLSLFSVYWSFPTSLGDGSAMTSFRIETDLGAALVYLYQAHTGVSGKGFVDSLACWEDGGDVVVETNGT
ncbi:hypothetical protein K458DRAFT_487379 [Lentithecium fluviatile CBS 122367]|uniref:Uncharacterized protein n=1 Tax=Lentithecium fluviatile CBS 122367 TaxID=1168545 RepID=A0A6G1J283_9PLEO|nr:hypothetical protein K458DRAFT_487379 [Lentithecium fluviatile CBS 122367]